MTDSPEQPSDEELSELIDDEENSVMKSQIVMNRVLKLVFRHLLKMRAELTQRRGIFDG